MRMMRTRVILEISASSNRDHAIYPEGRGHTANLTTVHFTLATDRSYRSLVAGDMLVILDLSENST